GNLVARALVAGAALGLACMSTTGLAADSSSAKPIPVAVTANKASPVGLAIFQGAELAAAEINAAGGINGRHIQLNSYDTHASSTEAVSGFQHAVERAHAVAV